MRWGPYYEGLSKLAESGESVPALDSRPSLPPHLERIAHAFDVLSKRRSLTMDGVPLSIPIAEIAAYLDLYRVPLVDRVEFVELIDRMDSAYLEDRYEYMNQQTRKVRSSVSKPVHGGARRA